MCCDCRPRGHGQERRDTRLVVVSAAAAAADRRRQRISDILIGLAGDGSGQLRLGDVVAALGDRGYGLLIFILALPNVLPIYIPGLSAVFGVPLGLIAIQMTIGLPRPWLPRTLLERPLRRQEFARMTQRILPWLAEASFDPPWVRDLARMSGKDEVSMRRLLQKLARQGTLYQVVRDLFYLPETVARLATVVQELEHATGETRAAEFRDRTGLGRKRAVQVLEFFDRVGYTRRVREAHRLRNADMFGGEEHAA